MMKVSEFNSYWPIIIFMNRNNDLCYHHSGKGYKLRHDIVLWLSANIEKFKLTTGGYRDVDYPVTIFFRSKKDAMYFKLMYG